MADARNCRHCGHTVVPASSDRGNSAAPADDQRIWKHQGIATAQVSMLDDQTITPWACKSSIDGRWHPASPVLTIADLADVQRRTGIILETSTADTPAPAGNPWTPLGFLDDGQGFTFTPNPNEDWYDKDMLAGARRYKGILTVRRTDLAKQRYMEKLRRKKRARRIRIVALWALGLGLWFGGWVAINTLLP